MNLQSLGGMNYLLNSKNGSELVGVQKCEAVKQTWILLLSVEDIFWSNTY